MQYIANKLSVPIGGEFYKVVWYRNFLSLKYILEYAAIADYRKAIDYIMFGHYSKYDARYSL